MSKSDKNFIFDINEILNSIPHRYPMLLIDRVVEFSPNESVVCLKNVSINEPFFVGHFPQKPIMPGVLIVEAMAQASAILVIKTLDLNICNKLVYFMSIENAKFRKPVTPGDSMFLHIATEKSRGNIWKCSGIAKVEEKIVAEATFTAMIVDNAY